MEPSKITLKKATVEDILSLILVEKELAGTKTYSAMTDEKEWEEEIKKENATVYLILKDNEIVGNISYEVDGERAHIGGLAIKPKFQGIGIGKKALGIVLNELKDVKEISLATHPENEKAMKLYKSFGFTVKERKENYFGDGEPRNILVKKQQ